MNLASRSKTNTPSHDHNGHAPRKLSPGLTSSTPVQAEKGVSGTDKDVQTTSVKANDDEADDASPALESVEVSVAAAAADVQSTPKYTPNNKNNNPSSSSKPLTSGHFGRYGDAL